MAKQAGKIIRIGKELELILKKKRREDETWDQVLRRCFGLPDRRGRPQSTPHLVHYFWVLYNSGSPLAFTSEAEAKGHAITLAIKHGSKKTERIIPVGEIIK